MADDALLRASAADFRRTKNDLGDPFKTERMSASLPSYGRAPPMPRQLREFLAGAPQAPNQQRVFGQPRRADRTPPGAPTRHRERRVEGVRRLGRSPVLGPVQENLAPQPKIVYYSSRFAQPFSTKAGNR